MFLVTITRRALPQFLGHHSSRQFSIAPGWVLTGVADNFLSRLDVAGDEITVSESLMAGLENRDRDVPFVAARFQRSQNTLQVSKHSVSGRPVYYCVDANGSFFLSTHIAMLKQAGFPIEEDPGVLPEILTYRVVAPPRTLYRNLYQLQFAGQLVVRLENQGWTVNDAQVGYDSPVAATAKREEEQVAEVHDALNESIVKLDSIGPRTATLLSGGIDSSILSVITRDRLSAYDTYSTAYPFDKTEDNDEQKYALSAAAALSTRHTLFNPTATDFLTGFIEALAVVEAPLHHLQSVLLHLLFKQGVPNSMDRIICGEAADSAFGMPVHFRWRQPLGLRRGVASSRPGQAALRALGLGWARARHHAEDVAQLRRLRLSFSDPLHPIWSVGAYGDFTWVKNHYGASPEEIVASRCAYLQRIQHKGFNDLLSIYLMNNSVVHTTAIWSKLGEGQGKIVYYPFAGKGVLDTAFSIPWGTKLKAEKHIIRQVARRVGVPEFIINRPKRWFGIVSDQWAVRGGPLEPLIAVAAKVVDIKQLRSLQSTDQNQAMTLWSLLNYAVLKRLFVAGENKQALLDEVAESCERAKASGFSKSQVPLQPIEA
jgi:asparagine synthetase B (glutamine-hydrolysing)